ncbi:HesA/MoeB/ThiF family protein [Rhodobacteraceae bacterium CCMM004]|nr:HesA/MoeB/ThiF family protein [Rhodobacteraceae bacterium CCMM004]
MALVIVLAVALWYLGRWRGVDTQARWTAIALLYLAVLAVNVALPPNHPLRAMTGGSAGEWLVLGGLAALVWGYKRVLGRVRTSVRPENRPAAAPAPGTAPPGTAGPAYAPGEVERYARHIVLREIGGPGQKRLKQAAVLVVGAGGLGSPALLYLAGAGIGTLGVIDDDAVDATNLQRQVIHADARIGMPKVFSAEQAIRALNPYVHVRPYHRRLTEDIARDLVGDYDLVLDGCDDAATRYVVNAACAAARVPLISGALSQWEGQITTFAPWDGTPCYRCLFPKPAAVGLAPSCAEGGVLGPLPGVVGAMMAVEAVKELVGIGQGLRGRLHVHDALWGEHRTMAIRPDPDCPVCGDAQAAGSASG